jgi:hypothetical protein
MAPKPQYLNSFPQPLLDELVAGRWLPIVGAGLSANAEVPPGLEIPLWDELGHGVAEDLPDHYYAGAIDALSAYEHEFGRRALVSRLHRDLLIDEARPGPAHDAFCRLRFDRVITTNFEFLLERSYERLGERCDVVIDEQQLPIPSRRNATVLLKLHGDLRHPGRLVVTEDDYDGFLARFPVLATHVASLLIQRVPVLIGFSLDDPDLRQLLAILKDRLGVMLPNAYVVVVAASAGTVARFARRGVKVISLPGSRARYGDILSAALGELDAYWREHVLDEAQFTEERPLEEVETSVGKRSPRLCYFSIPASSLAFYRDEVFPVAEAAGLVPVSGFDVEVTQGNRLAATRALLERARAAVVDVSTGVGSTELLVATRILGSPNVAVVAAGKAPAWAVASGAEILHGLQDSVESADEFFDQLTQWFERRRVPRNEPGSESEALLATKHWRAALVAAIAELEAALRDSWQATEIAAPGRGPLSLSRLLRSPTIAIDGTLRTRLLHWIALRNAALHEGGDVRPADARHAVKDVAAVVRALG